MFRIFSIAQVPNSRIPNKAPVVLDGQALFEVGKFKEFSAEERASIINQALIDTVKSDKNISIEVIKIGEEVTIRNTSSDLHLLSITQEDFISAATIDEQATKWKRVLEEALQKAQKERTTIYKSKALFDTISVILVAITLHISLRFFRKLSSHKLSNLLNSQPIFQSWHKLLLRVKRLSILGLQSIIWIAALFYTTNLFPETRSWRYWLLYWLDSPSISLGDQSYSPLEIVFLLSLTLAVWFFVRVFTNSLKYYVLRQIGAEQAIQEIIAVFLQYVLTFLALIILWQS